MESRVRHEYWEEHDTGMLFVWVPGGKFLMGNPDTELIRLKGPGLCNARTREPVGRVVEDGERLEETSTDEERPVHEVEVDGFWMGRYPVTQDEWSRVMGFNPSHFQLGPRHPVENVTWYDCHSFIREMERTGRGSYRLPTEAEWEYACRAGTTSRYWFGDMIDMSQANYDSRCYYDEKNQVYHIDNNREWRNATTPVDMFSGNPFGLHDMHGNVWEWCQDWYGEKYYANSPLSNPKDPSTGCHRVRRGGSWYFYPAYVRSAFRNNNVPGIRYHHLGFRLSRTYP